MVETQYDVVIAGCGPRRYDRMAETKTYNICCLPFGCEGEIVVSGEHIREVKGFGCSRGQQYMIAARGMNAAVG